MFTGHCHRCTGNLYLDIDISLEGSLYQKCLQCGREYKRSGESVSRLSDLQPEPRRGIRHYGRPRLPVAV